MHNETTTPAMTAAAKSDHAEIVEVWEASVRATHDFLPDSDIEFYRPLILNEYLDAVDLRCARDAHGAILGFIGVADGVIEMLFVHPAHLGNGIGKALLTHAVREMSAISVDVNEQNPRAVGFYEHMGFRQVARSELDAMGKPYPLLHMKLRQPLAI